MLKPCNKFADYCLFDYVTLNSVYFIKQEKGTIVINGDGETFLENVFFNSFTPYTELEKFKQAGPGNRELLKKYGKQDYLYEMRQSGHILTTTDAIGSEDFSESCIMTLRKYRPERLREDLRK